MEQALPVLRGRDFASRLRAIFAGGLPVTPAAAKHRRILIPAISGGEHQWALLGFIGQALRMRGAHVTALLCDELLPACTLRKVDHVEPACTRWCHRHAGPFAEAMGLPHRWYGELLAPRRVEACRGKAAALPREALLELRHDGLELGEHVARSLESYFKVGTVDLADPAVEAAARDFAAAALMLVEIAGRALDELRIEKVLLSDGYKTDWGVFRAVARARGIPVDVAAAGIRGTSVRFEIDRPPHPPALMPQWPQWRRRPLTDAQQRELDEYLTRRERVPYEYRADFWRSEQTDPGVVRRRLELPDRPDGLVFAMFPNVGFDAGKTKSAAAAYPAAQQWIEDTVRIFARRRRHHLLLKGHPAEHHRAARETVLGQALASLGTLPANVRVIPPDTDVSAHSVVKLADVVLTYTSTVTAEAAALGKPVILAGGGWHAGRGVFTEAATPADYRTLVATICDRGEPPAVDVELARRYAYSLFFRNDIPLRHYRRRDIHIAELRVASPADLAPGADPSLEAICRGVLLDEPFENPATREAGGTAAGGRVAAAAQVP